MPPKGSTKAKSSGRPTQAESAPARSSPAKKKFTALDDAGEGTCPVGVDFEGDLKVSAQGKTGSFVHVLKLEAPASFSLVNTQLLSEGPYAGHQAIIICPAKSFPFMKLPDEVRYRVYKYYFANNGIVGKEIALDNKRKEGKRMYAKFFIEGVKNRVGLLTVNKQVYNEASPVLYSHVLSFADTSTVMEFMLDLTPRARELLQFIDVKTYVKTTSRNAMNTLADAVNLKRLRITQGVATESDPAKAAKALYTDMYKLLESIGRKLGDKRAAVDVLSFGRDAFKFKDGDKKETFYTTDMILEVKEALKDRISA